MRFISFPSGSLRSLPSPLAGPPASTGSTKSVGPAARAVAAAIASGVP